MAIIIQKSLPNHRGSYIYGHPRGSNSGFFSINVVNMTITRQFVRLTHIKWLKTHLASSVIIISQNTY